MSKEAKVISADELKQHKDASSLWIAIHDRVYDVTKFLDEVKFSFVGQSLPHCVPDTYEVPHLKLNSTSK